MSLVTTLMATLASGAVQAQAVSPVTVTPPSLAPEHRDGGLRVEIPETGALQAPAGAEGLSITLGEVRVEGGFAEVAGQTDAVVQGLRGRKVSLKDIYAAASRIEAIHARAGYVLARVSVPPQDLRDGGALRLVITDGFIESVDVSGLPARIRSAMRARVARLEGRRHVTLRQIEQALLIAGDAPGLTLRSTLMRGLQPGGTRIVLEGRQRLLSGSLGADNQIDPSLGRWGFNLQLALNSALGLGEQIYGFVASDYDLTHAFNGSARERVLGGGIILPLGDGRFSLNPEVTFARTLPEAAAGSPPTLGELHRLTLRASETLIRTRDSQAGLTLAIEQMDERNTITLGNVAISHDRYMVLRPGAAWSLIRPGSASYGLSAQFSRGLSGLGAISSADAAASGIPFSRQGTDNAFNKLSASARAGWAMGHGLSLSLSARGQTSFGKAVFRAEQFALEGADGLSAYVGGRTAVDAGFALRTELARPVGAGTGLVSGVTPYAFGAFGAGRLEDPTAVERAHISAFNLGAGLRATLARQVALSVEYARGLSDDAALDNVNRINASATLRF